MNEQQVVFWYWWVLGAVFMVLEMLAPGTFMLWLAVACGVVGLMVLLAPELSLALQFVFFSVISVASVIWWKMYLRRHPIQTDKPTLNEPGQEYVSRIFTLTEAIVNGRGRAQVGDTVWSVSGPDLPVGAKVRCVGVEGTVLQVEGTE